MATIKTEIKSLYWLSNISNEWTVSLREICNSDTIIKENAEE